MQIATVIMLTEEGVQVKRFKTGPVYTIDRKGSRLCVGTGFIGTSRSELMARVVAHAKVIRDISELTESMRFPSTLTRTEECERELELGDNYDIELHDKNETGRDFIRQLTLCI